MSFYTIDFLKKNILYILFALLVFLTSNKQISFANTLEESEPSAIKIERHFVFDTLPLNLEEITNDSDRIFTGICTNVEEIDNDSQSNLPVFKYTFKITDAIKGVQGKEEISFKQWKPTVRTAGYDVGKKYVLFLYPNSERGLTSPVGFLQGQFEVEKKGFIRRKEVVKNKQNNKGLSRNLRTQKKINISDQYISSYVDECAELGISMRYKEFVTAVRYLTKSNKGN